MNPEKSSKIYLTTTAVEAVPFHSLLPPTGWPEGPVARPVVGETAGRANIPLAAVAMTKLTFDTVETDPRG